MELDGFLGNERVKSNLRAALERGRISHFYLICGPAGSGKRTLARLLAAAIVCKGDPKPCGVCAACRKIRDGNHPDFITVDQPDKKTVSVELVRQARADLYIRPNEAAHKIYLFPRAQDMGISAQNALLKVLEEPPEYAVFLLLTDNPEKLLPTVRSRCTELSLGALEEKTLLSALRGQYPNADEEELRAAARQSGGFLGQARQILDGKAKRPAQTEAFADAFAASDALELTRTLVPMEKWKREPLAEILQQWAELLTQALACRCGVESVDPLAKKIGVSRSPEKIRGAVSVLEKCMDYCRGNVSPGAICGYLAWALR